MKKMPHKRINVVHSKVKESLDNRNPKTLITAADELTQQNEMMWLWTTEFRVHSNLQRLPLPKWRGMFKERVKDLMVKVKSLNVRTMFETSKTAHAIKEMQNYNLDILCEGESRRTGSGLKVTSDGVIILFSGKDNVHSSAVVLIINKQTAKSLMELEPISDRHITGRFAN